MSSINRSSANSFANINTNTISDGFSDIDNERDAWSDAHANFLSSLSQEETQDLLKISRQQRLKSRDYLFRAGDRSSDVYIVASGCIRLFKVSSTGKENILWLSFPGEIFGMTELLRSRNRQVHAVANEATQIFSINIKSFTDFLGRHPEVAMKAIGILSARVRTLSHAVIGIASDNVETRIARLLIRFAAISSGTRCCTSSTDNNELCVNVRLTHQDIANLVGASRQTVSSTLAQLRKMGAVRTVNQHIHIVQPDHMLHLLRLSAA